MSTPRTRVAVVFALALAAGPSRAAGAEDFRVIANPALPQSSITREELSRAFLKKTTRWPGGAEIRPVEPRAGAPARVAFLAQVHRVSADALRGYWTQMIFSGRDVPPVEKGTDEQIVAYVREHPGALGYVSPSAVTTGVKVLGLRP